MVSKFATHVVDTSGAHLDLCISLGNFEKIGNDPNVIFRCLGEDYS
jgi:hypothetical protein